MVTCIDVGNTDIKIAQVNGGMVGRVSRTPTSLDPHTTADRLPLGGPAAIAAAQVALVSVVPAWSMAIRDIVAGLGWSLLEADATTIPLRVDLPHPERVGADRLLGAWTARELFGAPVLVVDVGTATTIDVVDAQGIFLGGAIMPGPRLAIRSLGSTALLPGVAATVPERAIGRDTVEAIQSGVVLGHLAAIAGLVALMTDELGGSIVPRVILTGGGSTALGSIDSVDRVEPNLLLRGLAMLAERVAVTQ
jgi:type III pantothenate kinase